MSLAGRIPELAIVDILQLMTVAGKTGVVRMAGSRAGVDESGAIYVRDGKPVAAETDGLMGEPALEVISSWDSGSFEFREGATTPQENLDRPFLGLVQLISSARREWDEIRDMLPASQARVRLASDLPPSLTEVRLSREEWQMVATMTASQPLSELLQRGGGGLKAHQTLKKLLEEGLVELEQQEPRA